MSNIIDALTETVRGRVITRSDSDYDEARAVYNAMHDRKPRAVIQCVDSADVMAAVAAGRDAGLDVAIRGGGHSVPGFGTVEDGLVIDLSKMKNVRVDPIKKVARVGGGATWGDVDHATYPFGLAAPGGIISTTGVGGLTLGGGIGYLTRGVGLSIDNLLAADVVLADGRQVTASDYQNEDLFWALRGGGGNFGLHRQGTRAARLLLRLADRTSSADYSRESGRGFVLCARHLLERSEGGGRAGAATAARCGGSEG
jgi:FAD/FMN-containing dehydrogenase